MAAEGRWIGGEVPIDRPQWRQGFRDKFLAPADSTMLAAVVGADQQTIIGHVGMEGHRGVAELGMLVASDWRGRGVGSALLAAAVDWARTGGFHKVVLQVWPHNESARQLYERAGFVEEGYLHRHYRRRSGALWDAVMMGLVLDQSSPGGP